MTKLSFGGHPYLLGFEQLERLVERTAKTAAEGYPPFNIEAVAENAYRITLAVAGFCEDDIAITVEDRQLVIRGRQSDTECERVFLHRGIGARAFQRSFVLAEGVEVAGATMEHGLLHIDLRRSVPQAVVQTIPIGRGKAGPSRPSAMEVSGEAAAMLSDAASGQIRASKVKSGKEGTGR